MMSSRTRRWRTVTMTGGGVESRSRTAREAAAALCRIATASRSAHVEPGIASGTSARTSSIVTSPDGRYSAELLELRAARLPCRRRSTSLSRTKAPTRFASSCAAPRPGRTCHVPRPAPRSSAPSRLPSAPGFRALHRLPLSTAWPSASTPPTACRIRRGSPTNARPFPGATDPDEIGDGRAHPVFQRRARRFSDDHERPRPRRTALCPPARAIRAIRSRASSIRSGHRRARASVQSARRRAAASATPARPLLRVRAA